MKSNNSSSKHVKYNEKRKPLFRVELVPSDNLELWKQVKTDLVEKSGSAKAGILEMYQKAKKDGYFDN